MKTTSLILVIFATFSFCSLVLIKVDSKGEMIEYQTINGNFDNRQAQFELTIAVDGSGTTNPAPRSYMYDEGTMVPVEALPDDGWMLEYWELDNVPVSGSNPYDVTMDANHTLIALFEELAQFELVITVNGSGTTNPAPGTRMYHEWTVVPVGALPAAGWTLDHWKIDNVPAGDSDPCYVTMNTNHTLTAFMLPLNYTDLLEEYTNLLSNYTDLLAEYTALNASCFAHNYTELFSDYTNLNASYYALLSDLTQLTKTHKNEVEILLDLYIDLDDGYRNLDKNYDTLKQSYTHLLTNYTSLQTSYGSLGSSLTNLWQMRSSYDALVIELEAARLLNYVFIFAMMVFIATTVYLVFRKQKTNAVT